MSLKAATLHETQTIYSLRDVYDLIEMAVVDLRNRRTAAKINGPRS